MYLGFTKDVKIVVVDFNPNIRSSNKASYFI